MSAWDDEIIAQFKYQFPDHFVFECGPGWAGILLEMCRRVDLALDDEWKEIFKWSQVKEKFGTLRAYNNGPDKIEEIVDWAESATRVTCEECGKLGRFMNRGWIGVRCPEHSGPFEAI